MTGADRYFRKRMGSEEYRNAYMAEREKMRTYPHCDSRVLHRPGACKYCDIYAADLQDQRIVQGVNFTGDSYPNLLPDPASQARPLEKINAWGGNVPTPEGYTTIFYSPELVKEEDAREFYKNFKIEISEIEDEQCDLPPKGWYCNLNKGHDGACPTWPTRWTKIKNYLLGRKY